MALSREGLIFRNLSRIIDIKAEEVPSLLWSSAYFFFILSSYYIIRPLRDEMALAGGLESLAWLFSGTLITMLLANPLFSALVARFPRIRFTSYTYRFFMFTLLIFFLALRATADLQLENIWTGRIFFIWTSVFNLYVVAVFWSVMADTFTSPQGKRLFGFIALGGTLGGIAGSALTTLIVSVTPRENLLLLALLLLEIATQCMRRIPKMGSSSNLQFDHPVAPALDEPSMESPSVRQGSEKEPVVGGSSFAGITAVLRSSYLMGISGYMLLFTVTATVLYFQQAEIVDHSLIDRAARAAFFAKVDLAVNFLTVVAQLFLAGKTIRVLGIGLTLALLPGLCIAGFTWLALSPTLSLVIIFQVLRRAANFGLIRPAREVLFTVLDREAKYKAKTFIDTFIYRAGDQIGAWSYTAVLSLGIGLSGAATLSIPLSVGWLVIAFWLGRAQAHRARNR